MKKLLTYTFLIMILISCNQVVSQKQNEELQKEKEFEALMKKVSDIREKNKSIMDAADQQTSQIIQKTSETISTLKEENKNLKEKLEKNETTPNIDTFIDIKFSLRPISDH